MPFSITKTTKEKLPRHPFEKMALRVLGKKYDLNLAIVNKKKIQELNKKYRQKDTPTDILSFPLDENSGEIFLCLAEAKKEAPKFDRNYSNFVGFLLIHGLMHLKGFDHSSTMEDNEVIIRKEFNI